MARFGAFVALVAALCLDAASAAALRNTSEASPTAATGRSEAHLNATSVGGAPVAQRFMEVKLGPFADAGKACDYCFGSFTKQGQPPAGPIAPACVCMAYPDGSSHNMFCATPTSAAGYIAGKGGCRCKPRDMEHMAATTC